MRSVAALAGEPLDALVWRETGAGSPTVEAVLAANPGLAPVGDALPEGTLVILPDPAPAPVTIDLVQLWT